MALEGEIDESLRRWDQDNNVPVVYIDQMKNYADHLAIASETLFYLRKGYGRQPSVINNPLSEDSKVVLGIKDGGNE